MQKIRPDMDIGNNIRTLRKSAHMKQDDVVAQMQLLGIDITRSTYAKIEANIMKIKVIELFALKIILNCEFSDFFQDLQL